MKLDHIAIAGDNLDAAQAFVEDALGVPMQTGGQHPVFGTHNMLLGLADGLYLEAIAIDPGATPERTPRWFDLDQVSGPPHLRTWICQTDDLPRELATAPDGAGQPVALSRGALRWDMAVPETGRLPYDNLYPALIQWHSAHPAPLLVQQGCRLRRLTVTHSEAEALKAALPGLGDLVAFETGECALVADIETPHGSRTLC